MVNEPNSKIKQNKQIEYVFGKTKTLNWRKKPEKNLDGRNEFTLKGTATRNSYH